MKHNDLYQGYFHKTKNSLSGIRNNEQCLLNIFIHWALLWMLLDILSHLMPMRTSLEIINKFQDLVDIYTFQLKANYFSVFVSLSKERKVKENK